MEITLSNKKLIYYSQVIQDEVTGLKKEIILNDDKVNFFIESQPVGTYIKNTKEVQKKMPTDKKRGYLHGGIVAELSKHIGVADRKWVKDQLKKIFLKIDFKKNFEGKVILDQNGLPIPVQNQFFDLTVDEIKGYYSMYKFSPDDLVYPTHLLSDEAYGRFIQVVSEYLREQFGLVVEANRIF